MTLSTRQRFEVLKRDGFTCQYCGRRPPDVELHVDHIIPRAEGGPNDPDNYIASCSECNLGKGPRPLVVVKPCAFCGEHRAGFFFELVEPHHLDNPLTPTEWADLATWELVCRECIWSALRYYTRAIYLGRKRGRESSPWSAVGGSG